MVGYDGQAFIENLQPHNHLHARVVVQGKELDCTAEFDYRASPDGSGTLPVIGPVRCAAGPSS